MIFKLLGIVGGWPCEGAILAEGVSWCGKDFLGGLVHQGHYNLPPHLSPLREMCLISR